MQGGCPVVLIKLIRIKTIEFAILLSNMVADSSDKGQNIMKCSRCGKVHLPQQGCQPNLPKQGLQQYEPSVFESLEFEQAENDLPQFEAPKFDLPQTGPLDPEEAQFNLPRYKPPLFDLPKSRNHLT